MSEAAYTPEAVTEETKIHGVATAGGAPPTESRGFQIRGTRGDNYTEEIEFGADLHGDMVVLGFWGPFRMSVFGVHDVGTCAVSFQGEDPRQIMSITIGTKRGNILSPTSRDKGTSRHSCSQCRVCWGKRQRRHLR